MKTLIKLVAFIVILYVIYCMIPFMLIWKDTFLSLTMKGSLKGKIIYSRFGYEIKSIELPYGKKKEIRSVPPGPYSYPGYIYNPYFSPLGDKIVFSQIDNPRIELREKLYIMGVDGQDVKCFLEDGNFSVLCPSWSPDGKSIAFLVRDGVRRGLYITDVNNSNNFKRIIDIQPSPSQPAWSPDSDMIAFSFEDIATRELGRDIYEDRDMGGIYVVDIQTGQIRRKIPLAEQPAWSPNGRKLVYMRNTGYYIIDIYDFSDSSEYLLVPSKPLYFGDRSPRPVRWSPDGKYIAFWKEIWPGLAALYAVEVNNPSRRALITYDSREIIGMSWAK